MTTAMTAFPLDDTYYLAEDMRLFHAGRTEGVLNVTGNDFQVKAAGGMNVTVENGVAYTHTKIDEFGGIMVSPRQQVSLSAPVADAYDRYDYVAIRYLQETNQCTLVYVKGGTEAPQAPTRSLTQFDLILAIIKVRANAGSIAQTDIQDVRMNETYCGLTVDTLSKIPTDGFQGQWEDWWNGIVPETEEATVEAQTAAANCNDALSSLQLIMYDYDGGDPYTQITEDDDDINGGYPVTVGEVAN